MFSSKEVGANAKSRRDRMSEDKSNKIFFDRYCQRFLLSLLTMSASSTKQRSSARVAKSPSQKMRSRLRSHIKAVGR